MPDLTTKFGLKKPAINENYDVQVPNDNMDVIEKQLSNTALFEKAAGTATAIVLTGIDLVDGRSKTFVATVNNNAVATTINGKPLYKPGTTTAPKLVAGKAVTVWYDAAGDCFFIKASAEGDAVAANVLAEKTFSNDDDTGIVGTMPNRGAVDITLTNQDQIYTVSAGYHSGLGKVKAVISNLIAGVIKAGETVGGILGTFTADATATAAKILSGYTAYVNGNKVTGTIPSKGAATITPSTANQVIAAGQYLSGDQTIAGDADLVSGNVRATANIFGVQGDSNVVNTSSGDATAADMLLNKKSYVKGNLVTGNIPSKGAETITPGTANKTIAAGQYLSGVQTILGDPDLIASNILAPANIFGVAGTAQSRRYAHGWVTASMDSKPFNDKDGNPWYMYAVYVPVGFTPTGVVILSGASAYTLFLEDESEWFEIHQRSTGSAAVRLSAISGGAAVIGSTCTLPSPTASAIAPGSLHWFAWA